MRWPLFAVSMMLLLMTAGGVRGQAVAAPDAPLPDIPALMRAVEANERTAEEANKNYIFHVSIRQQQVDKKLVTAERENFYLNGVLVSRLLAKDGKPLTADEKKKEDERIDKDAAKAGERREKADDAGKETDPRGHDVLTVARILELGAFSNARRVMVAGRPTIAVDYTGDPKAKTHNDAEGLFRELAGTVWIDEQDKVLQHAEGHFDHDFKKGFGLLVDVHKGTAFSATFRKVNDEAWLPVAFEGQGYARYLLFFSFNGTASFRMSDYRKFKATSKILPVEPGVVPPE